MYMYKVTYTHRKRLVSDPTRKSVYEGRDDCKCHTTYVPVDIAELFEVTCIHFLCRDWTSHAQEPAKRAPRLSTVRTVTVHIWVLQYICQPLSTVQNELEIRYCIMTASSAVDPERFIPDPVFSAIPNEKLPIGGK
jgi:hypothetical protein